jgi:hypothetical protein
MRASIALQRGNNVELLAREAVARHGHFRGRADRLESLQRENMLVVRGAVPSYYLEQVLQTALKGLQGVSWIDHQVAVVACDGLSSVSEESATRIAA